MKYLDNKQKNNDVKLNPNIKLKITCFLAILVLFFVFMCILGCNNYAKYLNNKGFYSSSEILYKYEILFSKLFSKHKVIYNQNKLAEFYIEQGLYNEAVEICNQILRQEKISENEELVTRKNKMLAYYYLNQYNKTRNEYKKINKIADKYKELGEGIYVLFPDKIKAEKIILNIEIDEGNFASIKNEIEKEDNFYNKQKIRYYRLNKDYKKALDIILLNLQNLPYVDPFEGTYYSEAILVNYADFIYELSKIYKDNDELVNINFSEANLFLNTGKNGVANAYCNGALVIYKMTYNERHPKVICTQRFCNSLTNKNTNKINKNAKFLLMIKRNKDSEKLDNYCDKKEKFR